MMRRAPNGSLRSLRTLASWVASATLLSVAQGAAAESVGSNVPWPSAHEGQAPQPPSFLDITDRRIRDTRPPPTPEMVQALEKLEAEAGRFVQVGGSYRDTILSLVKREYVRQRGERGEEFGTLIRAEEEKEDAARLNAIAAFERFVAKYPGDLTYTPDAMFRLGELYFERDAIRQQVEMDAYLDERDRLMEAGESNDALQEPQKSFEATIQTYRTLIANFPDYEKLDGAYYLIGYCLNEMGDPDEARLAWLNLVCANKFEYKGFKPPLSDEELAEEAADPAQAHPALALDGPEPMAPSGPFDDPYGDCQPAVADSKFFAETWLRVGEYHFDLDYSEYGLDRAISAYKNVLTRPEDRNYNLALYKVAWAYYRANRYPEAMSHFGQLVQWSDDERLRTGRQGSDLREEAIQYLGIGFAYDDWNENQIPDPVEGGPTALQRVQDPNLLPQDRPWTTEVYYRLGSVLFDEAKYPQAIEVWRLALSKWPMHPEAPQIQSQVAQAYAMHNEPQAATEARAQLSEYAEGSDWWVANEEHPAEQRMAQRLAEEALINSAIAQHQSAQRLRRQCVEETNLDLCRDAQEQYGLAASAYRHYIKAYPNSPEAYELRFNLADALFWSENYEEAAEEYAAVRDSNLDDKYLSTAARLVVESAKRLVDQQVKIGKLAIREEPPAPQGLPPRVTPIEMPEALQTLARARELYLARVSPEQDVEKVRDAYAYNNTLLLYKYGYWDLARERFYAIYADHCVGQTADDSGQVAWINLRNIAVALNQTDEVRRLGADLQTRACTFKPEGGVVAAVDCSQPENRDAPTCLAVTDLTNLRYGDAVEIYAQAEKATGDERRLLFEQAASELIKAVNEEPDHPQAPLALEKAALALEQTSRFESAARLYQRIVDEVGPRKAASPEEQQQLDAILANAYFRLAYNSNRFFDFDRAVDNYRVLADSPRFRGAEGENFTEWREGALINAAKILEYQQRYAEAAKYYDRAAGILQDPAEVRAANYRKAEMAYKLENWPSTIREMKAFIARHQKDREGGELIVQAYWRIAQAQKARGRKADAERALRDVVSAYANSGAPPGSLAAEYTAQAHFALVDDGVERFESFAIKPGNPPSLKAYVDGVRKQIDGGAKEAKTRAEAYNVVPPYGRPPWTVAALVRQGRIYEILAKAVLNTPFVVPADLKKQMRGLPPDAQDDIKFQVEDAIRQVLDEQVRPIECLAVARYALASRAARAGSIDTEFTRIASDRINAYGDERIAECVEQAAKQDATFEAYRPGEFSRAPRGKTVDIPSGIAPPALRGGKR